MSLWFVEKKSTSASLAKTRRIHNVISCHYHVYINISTLVTDCLIVSDDQTIRQSDDQTIKQSNN